MHKQIKKPKAMKTQTIKTVTYTLPAYLASYLINGDASGLEDSEIQAIDEFLKANKISPISCEGEEYFSHRNDLNTMGGNVLEYVCQDLDTDSNEEETEENRENWRLLIGENRGVYCPKVFAETYWQKLIDANPISSELLRCIADLLDGPDNENYWESMSTIERDYKIFFGTTDRPKEYKIVQDGDIWAAPIED